MARVAKKAYSARDLSAASLRFKMLSSTTRLRILGALAQGAGNVGSMAILTEMSYPAVSHHLSLLRAASFVETTRDGHAIIYTLTDLGRAFWELAEKAIS